MFLQDAMAIHLIVVKTFHYKAKMFIYLFIEAKRAGDHLIQCDSSTEDKISWRALVSEIFQS